MNKSWFSIFFHEWHRTNLKISYTNDSQWIFKSFFYLEMKSKLIQRIRPKSLIHIHCITIHISEGRFKMGLDSCAKLVFALCISLASPNWIYAISKTNESFSVFDGHESIVKWVLLQNRWARARERAREISIRLAVYMECAIIIFGL